ncbi:MAG TPA: hypothetical protein VGJ84_23600, partial [Polyangiaceae bacterium]
MALVTRNTKGGVVHWVVMRWQGEQIWERAGKDRREAERLDARRKKEIAARTYQPPKTARALTLQQYAESVMAVRQVRSIADERRWLERHVYTRPWFANRRLDEIGSEDVERLVDELRAEGRLKDKSIGNLVGVLHLVFEKAIRAKRIPAPNPASLPRGTLKRARAKEPEIFAPVEIRLLTRHAKILWPIRALNALCLLAGLR